MATRKVIRGDSDSFKVTFLTKDSKGKTTPIDICGWDIRFTVRASVPSTTTTSDSDALIHKVADIIDGENGVAYFEINSKDTEIDPGEYWWDIQFIKPSSCSGNSEVKSVPKGKYIVLPDITRNERGY